jgi:hypothetical protein
MRNAGTSASQPSGQLGAGHGLIPLMLWPAAHLV